MAHSLSPGWEYIKKVCLVWEGSATILPAPLRDLEVYRSRRDSRLQPVTTSAEQIIHCSLPL